MLSNFTAQIMFSAFLFPELTVGDARNQRRVYRKKVIWLMNCQTRRGKGENAAQEQRQRRLRMLTSKRDSKMKKIIIIKPTTKMESSALHKIRNERDSQTGWEKNEKWTIPEIRLLRKAKRKQIQHGMNAVGNSIAALERIR